MNQKCKGGASKGRQGIVATAAVGAGIVGLWGALHTFPGFGPALADGARAVVGPAPIAWAEDVVYGVEDRIKRVLYQDAPPKTFWEPSPAADEPPAQPPIASNAPVAPTFVPEPFEPPVPSVAAQGDGRWIPIADPHAPGDPPAMYKTVVHPDARRSYAAVAVVALDLERLGLRLVAGTIEPESPTVPHSERPGVVPADQFGDLVAAFNGGFKAEHGHYGMMVDGRTFLPPRPSSCTVALYRGGSMRIRTFTALREDVAQMSAYRQTPPCLVEQDRINDTLLTADDAAGWGVSVGGGTVIRRSAIGLDHGGKTLLYAIGESVTAGTLARAMKVAGAENAAQLDVNQAYPRFVLYTAAAPSEAPRVASALIPDLVLHALRVRGEAFVARLLLRHAQAPLRVMGSRRGASPRWEAPPDTCGQTRGPSAALHRGRCRRRGWT